MHKNGNPARIIAKVPSLFLESLLFFRLAILKTTQRVVNKKAIKRAIKGTSNKLTGKCWGLVAAKISKQSAYKRMMVIWLVFNLFTTYIFLRFFKHKTNNTAKKQCYLGAGTVNPLLFFRLISAYRPWLWLTALPALEAERATAEEFRCKFLF